MSRYRAVCVRRIEMRVGYGRRCAWTFGPDGVPMRDTMIACGSMSLRSPGREEP